MEATVPPVINDASMRINAKNFLVTYPSEVPSSAITTKLSKVFKNSTISEMATKKGEKEFLISMVKRKNLTSTKKLTWRAFTPIVRPVLPSDKFQHLAYPSNQSMMEALNSFLSTPNVDDMRMLEQLLKEELQSTNIVVHSEYLLSSLVNSHLVSLGKQKKWENFKIFSIDSKIERVEGETLRNFRADTVVLFNDKLVVFEFKFRFDRIMKMGQRALKCLKERKYSDFIHYHLRRHYSSFYTNINSILEIGMGYCVKKSEINFDASYNEYIFK